MNKSKIKTRADRLPPVISIVGTSNSGKTTLLTNLLPKFKLMKIRVGVIKHHGHRSGRKKHSHSDTALIRDSGAAITILAAPGINGNSDESPQEIIKREMSGKVDLVLTEGYKNGPFPKIGISWPGRPDQLEPDESWVASIGGAYGDIPRFGVNEIKKLAEFIAAFLPEDFVPAETAEKPNPATSRNNLKKRAGKTKTAPKNKNAAATVKKARRVKLQVNGRDIELNRFVSGFIERSVLGMLSSLKGCEAPKKTVLRITDED